jgi:hypothetical protein
VERIPICDLATIDMDVLLHGDALTPNDELSHDEERASGIRLRTAA